MKKSADAERQPLATAEAARLLGDLLRNEGGRDAALTLLIELVRPEGAEPAIWSDWLHGGNHPFPPPLKPGHATQNSGREMSRSSTRVRSAERKVEVARQQLNDAESDLERINAQDSALMLGKIAEHLKQIISPVFAMGPAWVIMRIMGPHVTAQEMAEETVFASTSQAEEEIARRVAQERAADSKLCLEIVDLWAGNTGFERELRRAILTVVQKFAARADKAEKEGLWRRPRDRYATSVKGDALRSVSDTLDGYRGSAK